MVYVPDASRAVGVVTKLLSIDHAAGYKAEAAADYEKVRPARQQEGVTLVTLDARANCFAWNADPPPTCRRTGRARPARVLREVDLAALVDYIDWGPFFQTWDLAGSYPKILDDATVGEAARGVFADGQAMLAQIVREEWLTANAVFGLFPANAVGDDIEFYADASREKLMTWHSLRQQHERRAASRIGA